MNRRNVLFALLASLFGGLFIGWRKYGMASPRAVALAHNGIISLGRTPHLLGIRVFVNGKFIPHVISVNTNKGCVLAYGDDKSDPVKYLTKQRIYGYIEVDAADCMTPKLIDIDKDSIHGAEPEKHPTENKWRWRYAT